jgi:hypothetical protein
MEDCFNKLPNGRNAGAGFSHDRKLAGVSTHIKRWRLVSKRNYPLFEGPVKHIFTIIFSIGILNSSDHVSH